MDLAKSQAAAAALATDLDAAIETMPATNPQRACLVNAQQKSKALARWLKLAIEAPAKAAKAQAAVDKSIAEAAAALPKKPEAN